MISVQSHLQLLSGNSRLVFGIFLMMVWYSCSTPAKVVVPAKNTHPIEVKPEVYNPSTKKYEPANAQNTQIDTLTLEFSDEPALISDKQIKSNNPESASKTLNITLLLPLSEDDINKDITGEGSEKYFHYYAGLKLGLNKIQKQAKQINIDVVDLKASPEAIKPVIQSEKLQQSDLIIGPLRRDHLNETAKFVSDKEMVMVAPWNAFRTLENINQNYILIKSSLPTHCEALAHYALQLAKPSDIVLVGREKSKTLMNYFQSEVEKSSMTRPRFAQTTVKDDYKFGEEYRYLDTLKSVYIVTEFEDPAVVFNFLRHINMMRKSRNVTVIGMPSWQDYSRDFHSLFSQLKVVISASSFPDINDEKVVEFRKTFFKQFQNFPLKEAFEGYDAIQYLVQQLSTYGNQFHVAGSGDTYNGIAMPIRLEKIIDLTKPVDDRMKNNNILCIENKALNIIQFDQYKFIKLQ